MASFKLDSDYMTDHTSRYPRVLCVNVQRAARISSSALTQVDVSAGIGSVMVIMTVEICRMNRTAVSNIYCIIFSPFS